MNTYCNCCGELLGYCVCKRVIKPTEEEVVSALNKTYKIRIMTEYMKLKIAEQDWHAVSDAANDLREIEMEKE